VSTITTGITRTKTTGSAPARAFVVSELGDRRTIFRGVDWHTYNQLCQATGDGSHVRLVYDGKDLEIVDVGNIHEQIKELLATIVRAVVTRLEIDFVGSGQTMWQTEIRGLEADLSY
jgi:hypothetical protein